MGRFIKVRDATTYIQCTSSIGLSLSVKSLSFSLETKHMRTPPRINDEFGVVVQKVQETSIWLQVWHLTSNLKSCVLDGSYLVHLTTLWTWDNAGQSSTPKACHPGKKIIWSTVPQEYHPKHRPTPTDTKDTRFFFGVALLGISWVDDINDQDWYHVFIVQLLSASGSLQVQSLPHRSTLWILGLKHSAFDSLVENYLSIDE